MNADERLAYERRVGMRQAVIAASAGILLVAAVAVQLVGPHAKVDEQTLGLITENKRLTRDLVGSVARRARVLLARRDAVVPVELHPGPQSGGQARLRRHPRRRRRRRHRHQHPRLRDPRTARKAHDFVGLAAQTYPQANHLISSTVLVFPQLGNYLGVLLIAMATVLMSLNAMRVGLLTRFMGYFGIFAGVLVIFPLVPIPIVEGFWLVALAYLFTGRWPSGVPPAWRSGQAEPWPSSQELREQRATRGGGGGGSRGGGGGGGGGLFGGAAGGLFGGGRAKPAATPAPEPVGAPTPARTRSNTSKRKRKRRH